MPIPLLATSLIARFVDFVGPLFRGEQFHDNCIATGDYGVEIGFCGA